MKHVPTMTIATERILKEMGSQIRLARLRRNMPTSLVCEKADISRMTLWQIENGSPSVSIGSYAMVLQALGGLEDDLLLVAKDDVLGRTIQDLGLKERRRVRKRWKLMQKENILFV